MDIKDKVIVITGASQGIGKALAENLAAKGAKLVLAARSEEQIEALASGLPDAIAVKTDMRNPADISNLIEQAAKKYGRIDVLVNNAGQGMQASLENTDIEKYKEIMELNVFSVMRAMQAVIPQMRRQGGGMILNISSRVSQNYYPLLSAYASTKYALNCLSLTSRQELAPDNIQVAVFYPKLTATNFLTNSAATSGNWDSSRMATADTPEQVAEKIAEQIISEQAEAGM